MASKYVLITGCSAGGIGYALALSFQKRGFTVFATARSPKKMSDLESLPNMHLISLDVTVPDSIAAVVKEVEATTGGKLDVLVNNAGNQYVAPVLDIDVETAKALFDVNYWGAVRMIKAFGDMLVKARGTIVNVGSGAGVVPIPFQSTYNASKAAINHFSETLRLEVSPLHIRVITLMAGNVTSNFSANAPSVDLPSSSYYLPIKTEIEKGEQWSDMPTVKFAEAVVDDVVGGKSGKVWRGGNTNVLKWLLPWLPNFVVDYLMIANGRGLGKMPKV